MNKTNQFSPKQIEARKKWKQKYDAEKKLEAAKADWRRRKNNARARELRDELTLAKEIKAFRKKNGLPTNVIPESNPWTTKE